MSSHSRALRLADRARARTHLSVPAATAAWCMHRTRRLRLARGDATARSAHDRYTAHTRRARARTVRHRFKLSFANTVALVSILHRYL